MGRMGGSGGLILDIAIFRPNGLFLANARRSATRVINHEEKHESAINSRPIKTSQPSRQHHLKFA
jgi:hypothetical protein